MDLTKKESFVPNGSKTLPPSGRKKVTKFNTDEQTFERNFITPGRAMYDFLLRPSQLVSLTKNFRRSPYNEQIPIMVYNRADVEERAIEVWGTIENLDNARIMKAEEKSHYDQCRNSRRIEIDIIKANKKEMLVIGIAILVDLLNFCFKLIVWRITNSDSILAEAIHSAADTCNQAILAVGLCQVGKRASSRHPYGFSNVMFVSALISGVGIFCMGAAVSVFKGIRTLITPEHLQYHQFHWAFAVLAFGFITEVVTFSLAIHAIKEGAKKKQLRFWEYVTSSQEPGTTVVLMEDAVAVLGIIVAAGMLLSSLHTSSYVPDAVGSIVIGVLLGCVAVFLIVTNSTALVGRSIPATKLSAINEIIESDVMIRAIHDVKGIDMGSDLIRYKAEVDFDGAALTRLYLDHIDLNNLLVEVKRVRSLDDICSFMITHGENIIDLLGSQIDRIERKVRKQQPEVRHMDLEIL